jgi:hypothetical protein
MGSGVVMGGDSSGPEYNSASSGALASGGAMGWDSASAFSLLSMASASAVVIK